MNKYRVKEIISSIVIHCHLHHEITYNNNRILHYKPGVNFSTLRISLRRYNDKFRFLLRFSVGVSGEPCSMEYSFRENQLICSEDNLL